MIVMTTPAWGKRSVEQTLKNDRFRRNSSIDDFDVWKRPGGDVVFVPNPSLSGFEVEAAARNITERKMPLAYQPNPRTYLDPSGWHVFNLGPAMGYAVLAPYRKGTLVTFRRQYPGSYPLLMARWRHLRTDPFIQRYASKSGATRALKSFMCKKCRRKKGDLERGGMLCP